MSFSDIAASSSSARAAARPMQGARSNEDIVISQLGESLQRLQRNALSLKEKVNELRRRGQVNVAAKRDLDRQTQELKQLEIQLKNQLDAEMRMLDQQPRATIAQKRIALAKLLKDFDRVRASLAATTAECATIVVNVTESSSAKGGGPVGNGSGSNKNPFDEPDDSGAQSSSVRQPKLIQTLQGKDVDEAIMREREKELQKINRDIRLVNEMFKDMADIVDKQGVMVDEIVVSTEKSHEKAKAGLEHVKKAASNQSSCSVS